MKNIISFRRGSWRPWVTDFSPELSSLTVCPHTGKKLERLKPPLRNFSRSAEGALYYHRARRGEYDDDYFFDEYKRQYGRSYFEDEDNLRRLARSRLKMIRRLRPPPARLLEIGCAAGFFLTEAIAAGYQATGFEISPFASDHARNKLGLHVFCDSAENIKRSGTDSTGIEYELTAPFDIVAAFYVLEHIPDQRAVFSIISDLLAPGGVFCFALPSLKGPLYERDPVRWVESHPEDHFADYSPAALRQILPLYGLRLHTVRPASFHPERLPAESFLRKMPWLYRFYAGLVGYGDTMEGVVIKDRIQAF